MKPSPTLLAIGQAILPPGEFLRGLQPELFDEIYSDLGKIQRRLPGALNKVAAFLDLNALTQTGRRFTSLSAGRQQQLLNRWNNSMGPAGTSLALLSALLKLYYLDGPELCEHFGTPHNKAPEHPEPEPAYMQQAVAGYEVAGEELEADVVVAGSGAAGAIVAKELAEQGHAVLLVEAGKYFRRHHFTGRALHAFRNFYDWKVWKVTVGNALIPVPAGKTVGGSTTINTATSFRPPGWVYQGWVEQGLPELSEERMTPFFKDVEAALQIEPVPAELRGPHVEIMAAVAEARGYSHGPIRRNAPDCDGQNCCDMGCPSAGKYSMDRSYVPMALRHGAMLLTETRLCRAIIRGGKVRGALLESGGRRFSVAARRVVLCCGTLSSPQQMWKMDLGGPMVGQGLTIHPSGTVQARFSRNLRGFDSLVPSSYFIDQFKDERIYLILANLPLDFCGMPLQLVGPDLMREMERYEQFGNMGALLAESARGRLQRLPGGQVICNYSITPDDVRRLHRALALITELYFEAGAEQCYPAVRGWPVIRSAAELERFRRAKITPQQLMMTSYHPLGTCRMGHDPRTSVVDPHYQVHGVEGLSIVDGSVIPGPIGVNSQLTVMAFARRAADALARQLDA